MDWRRQRVLHPVDGVDDALLRSCVARDVRVVNLPEVSCAVTEDAILEWCFASDASTPSRRFLEVATDHISERFLQRFVELHESSEHINPLSLKIGVGRREFALAADWDVEQSDEMLRIRRLMRPITHREDLKDSSIRLDVCHQYSELWEGIRNEEPFPLRSDDALVIRRGVDTAQMEERFFVPVEQADDSSGPQDAVVPFS
ncbi:hypothetical protein AAVH_40889 [Aphelenchoides avenae]|nr:hypothetical protein AAVH_40889 [Aphelenchus avenae]